MWPAIDGGVVVVETCECAVRRGLFQLRLSGLRATGGGAEEEEEEKKEEEEQRRRRSKSRRRRRSAAGGPPGCWPCMPVERLEAGGEEHECQCGACAPVRREKNFSAREKSIFCAKVARQVGAGLAR